VAVAFRAAGAPVSGSKPQTPNLPAGLTTGDLMLMGVRVNAFNGGNPVTPAGWTLIGSPGTDSDSNFHAYFYKVAAAGEVAPAVSHSGTTAVMYVTIAAWSGADPANPIDVLGTPTRYPPSGFVGPYTIPGVTTSYALGAFVLVAADYELGSGQTVTSRTLNGSSAGVVNDSTVAFGTTEAWNFWHVQQAAAGATGNAVFALNANSTGMGVVIALKPPNPYSRPAYQFGAQQAVNRASTY
jgi:hypothetical protein